MKISVVMANCNEWTHSWDSFVGLYDDVKDTTDFTTQHQLLISNDDWRIGDTVDRYKIIEIDIPEWLIKGFSAKYGDRASYVAAKSMCGYCQPKLRKLADKKGKFADNLRQWFSENGYLTARQEQFI
jgi:hypothetical protein